MKIYVDIVRIHRYIPNFIHIYIMYKLYIYQALIYTNIAIYMHINLLLTYLQNQKIKRHVLSWPICNSVNIFKYEL